MSKLFFQHVALAAADPIFGLMTEYKADPRKQKINLSIGVYRDENSLTPVLESVKLAEEFLLQSEKTKEYLPIEGSKGFIEQVGALVFGDFIWVKERNHICGVQALGGSGALSLGGDFLKQEVGERIAISDPTWPNHRGIFSRCQMIVETYPYYDFKHQRLEFDRMVQYLKNCIPGTVVILQPCCHNPTGAELTMEEWKLLAQLFRKNGLLPFFDFAYQGFGSDLEEDAKAIRLFASEGLEMLVAASQSKNFGLYSERVGALFILSESQKTSENVLSKMKTIIRTNYSNPPRHGGLIVEHVLSTPRLKQMWVEEVGSMRKRIEQIRKALVGELVPRSRKRDFRFVENRAGMFCFTGLEKEEVERLKREFGIYMTLDGRMNLSDLNAVNLPAVVDAIITVIS